jgi:hypothetical protein
MNPSIFSIYPEFISCAIHQLSPPGQSSYIPFDANWPQIDLMSAWISLYAVCLPSSMLFLACLGRLDLWDSVLSSRDDPIV